MKLNLLAVFLFFWLFVFPNSAFAAETSYTYTNQEQDKSGLMHYDSRYYDPELGRFLQPDTFDVPNKYAYVSNNPVNYTDPTGHEPYPLPENLQSLYGEYPLPGPLSFNIKPQVQDFIATSWPGLSRDDFNFYGNVIGNDKLVETVLINPNGLELNDNIKNSYSNFRTRVSDHFGKMLNDRLSAKVKNKESVIKTLVEQYTVLDNIGLVAKDFSINVLAGLDNSMYPPLQTGDILLLKKFTPDKSLSDYGLNVDDIVQTNTGKYRPQVIKRVHGFKPLGKELNVILYMDNEMVNTNSPISSFNRSYYDTVNITNVLGKVNLFLRDGKWQSLP